MASSHVAIITQGLSDAERAMATRAVIAAAAPSSDSALLGAVRMLEILKKAGLEIPADVLAEAADPITVLDDWVVAVDGSRTIAIGAVRNDARRRFRDGEMIHTSRLSAARSDIREGAVVSTIHSRYRLGRPAKAVSAAHRRLSDHSGYEILAPRG